MGKYKILKKLGEGSFGTVFLVEDEKDQAIYVLKQISLTGMSAQELADCKKEISILSLMKHENIVSYVRSFTTKSTLCIVMEYADGGDLQREIEFVKEKKTHFAEDKVLTWFTQLACALQSVHSLRILHRDLKTQNIFLMKNGDVKLGDFGISKVLNGTLDKATTLVGTPYYLSPEMVNGQPYNQRTDIWALGIVLYELLSLQRPFQADSLQMLVLKIIAGDYPPVPSHYSAEIKALLGHCLQQDPNRRFTIEQVLDFPIVKAKARQMGKKLLHEEPLDDSVPPPPPPEEEAPESLPPPPPTKSVSHEEKEGDKKPSVSSAGEEKATPTPPVIPPPKQDPARNLPSSTKSDARPSTKSQLPALPNQNEAKEMPKATHDSSPNKAFPSSQTKDEEKKPALTSPNARNSVKPASTSQSNEAVVSEAGKSNTVSNSPFNPKSENDSQKKQSVSPVKRGSGPVVMPSSEIFKEAPKRPAPTKPAEKEKVDVAKKQVDEAEAAKVNKAASPGSGLAKRNSVKALVGQFSDEPSPQIAKVTAKPESPLERKSLPASAFSKEKKLPAPPSPMKSSPNQPLKEIEVEKANEEEPISETVKERLRRERSQGKLVDKPSESYVSKSEQTKILKKHLLEKLGKEKLDRLLVLLASKENDKSKADKIQDLVEGKKDILAMVHAYIYYNK